MTKMRYPAEAEPLASQRKHSSSITSFRKQPTIPWIQGVRSPVPTRVSHLGDAHAQTKGRMDVKSSWVSSVPALLRDGALFTYLHAMQLNKGHLPILGSAGTYTHQLTSWPETHRHMRDVELHECHGTNCRHSP